MSSSTSLFGPTSGDTGETGGKGTTSVVAGVIGAQGTANAVIGRTGSQGTTNAIQGRTGSQGTTNAVQGRIGSQGTTNAVQGTIGRLGTQGILGSRGTTNAVQGRIGSQGTTNAVQGRTGTQGVLGREGVIGAKGVLGRQGVLGAQGVSGAVPTGPPIPTGLAKTASTETSISMSWNSSAGATGYRIKRNGAVVYSGASTSFTDTSLTPCGEVSNTYSVEAYNLDGASGYSTGVVMIGSEDLTAPTVPTGLAKTGNTTTTVGISWNPSTDACSGMWSYPLWRNGSSIGISSVATNYVHTLLTAGTSYTFQVSAGDARGNVSSLSTAITACTLCVATTLSYVSGTSTTLTVSWTAVNGTSSYHIRRQRTSDGVGVTYGDVTSPWTLNNLEPNTSYDMYVIAYNACGDPGVQSNTITQSTAVNVAPSDITGLAAGTVTTTSIPFTWNAATDDVGVTRYNFYNSAGTDLYSASGTPPSPTTSYSPLSAGTTYTFKVKAYDGTLYSTNFSNTVTTCTLCIAPTLSYVSKTDTTVTVSWSAVTGASSYTLYWRATAGCSPIDITGVSSPYTKTGLGASTEYEFYVVALNCNNVASANSNTITQTTNASVPGSVGNLVQGATDDSSIYISWSVPSGSPTSYNIYRNSSLYTTSTTNNKTVIGLNPDTCWDWNVAGVNGNGEGVWSSTYNFCTDPLLCFVEGTLITLFNGEQIKIEELVYTDILLSSNIKTLNDTNNVNKLYEWKSTEILESRVSSNIILIEPSVSYSTIILNNGLLEATNKHSQLIKRDNIWRFIAIENIIIGDYLMDINGNEIEILTVSVNTDERNIYKLTLDNPHTYFANNILTHNVK